MFKKMLAVTLGLVLLVSLLSGCSGNSGSNASSGNTGTTSSSSSSSTESSTSSTQASTEAPANKVKLTAIYIKHPLTKDFNEMQWLKEVQDKVGVDIEWQQISADWDQKKAPMLASGDIPDLLFTAVGDADFAMFQGLFENLKPLVEQYAPNVQKMFEEKPETLMLSEQPDGSIYGLPKYQRFWPKTNSTMFINKLWLDNLSLSVPTTWDELYDVLVAFRDGDPNGNGDTTDEIPMDFTGRGAYSPILFLGSTGIQSTNWGSNENGYFSEDGVVKNFYMDERYKELMIYLNKLYTANLVNPEAFTADYSTFQSTARGQGSTAKVGFTWGWESGDRFGNELADQYISIAPLKQTASSPQPLWCYDFYGLNMDGNRVAMSAKCKDKEMAMKFVDALYDPEVSLQVLFGGISDGNIAKNDDGSYTILPPLDSSIDPGTWKWTSSWADGGTIYLPDSMNVTLGTDMQKVEHEKSVYDEAFSNLQTNDIFPIMFLKFTTEDNNELEMNRVNFRNIANAKWAEWFTTGGIEAGWDQYVADLKNSGIEKNNEILQRYYDAYLANMK